MDEIDACFNMFLIFCRKSPDVAEEVMRRFDAAAELEVCADQVFLGGMAALIDDLEGLGNGGPTALHARPLRLLQAMQAVYALGFERGAAGEG